MAEAACKDQCKDTDVSNNDFKEKGDMECAVCLQKCVHPAQLPCGHIFCFLCVKGIANQSKRCAMCRQEIPRDFIEQPNLLEKPNASEPSEGFDGGYLWFYEGRNGWWQYDPRANEEIEQMYNLKVPFCEYPKGRPQRKRFIKREKTEALGDTVKGVAGLKT